MLDLPLFLRESLLGRVPECALQYLTIPETLVLVEKFSGNSYSESQIEDAVAWLDEYMRVRDERYAREVQANAGTNDQSSAKPD